MIDAVVAVKDASLLSWVRSAHERGDLRLEPAAAAGFAAIEPFLEAAREAPAGSTISRWQDAVHVVWTTGGSLLPDDELEALLRA
jgi:D-serine dehydratase